MGAHTIGSSLLGHGTAQSKHSVLRGHVGRLEHRGELRMHRSGIENAPTPAGLIHMPQTRSRGQKSPIKVDRKYFLPIAERQIVNAADDLDPRVAAKDIDA